VRTRRGSRGGYFGELDLPSPNIGYERSYGRGGFGTAWGEERGLRFHGGAAGRYNGVNIIERQPVWA